MKLNYILKTQSKKCHVMWDWGGVTKVTWIDVHMNGCGRLTMPLQIHHSHGELLYLLHLIWTLKGQNVKCYMNTFVLFSFNNLSG